jgi:hypothetical protein
VSKELSRYRTVDWLTGFWANAFASTAIPPPALPGSGLRVESFSALLSAWLTKLPVQTRPAGIWL